MIDKTKVGTVACRQHKGSTEWLLIKLGNDWELPKGEIRRGESSVRAAIRYLKEEIGVKAPVLDEAGKTTESSSQKGSQQGQKLIYYLMKRSSGKSESQELGSWVTFTSACKRLRLIREQKMLRQASSILKEWAKIKKRKSL